MKTFSLIVAACAFATTTFAQTTPTTEVKVRDNGTEKITTKVGDEKMVTKTGRTNVGQTLDNTKDAAGNVAKKTGSAIKRGAKKVGGAVKRGANKTSSAAKRGSAKMEAKTE